MMQYMERLIRHLRKSPIRQRLSQNFLRLSLIPIIVVGVVSAVAIYSSMEKKTIAHSWNVTGQIIRSVTYYFEEFTQQIQRVAEDSAVLADLQAYDSASFSEQEQIENRIRLIFASTFGGNRSINTVELATPKGTRFYFHSPITNGSWDSPLSASLQDGEILRWTVGPKETALDNESYILLSQKLTKDSQEAGALFLSLRRSYLDEACRNSDATGSGYVVIADDQGYVVSHPDSSQVGTQLPEEVLAGVGREQTVFRMESALYVWDRLPSNHWLILNVFSYTALMQDAIQLLLFMAVACVVLVVLSQIVSVQITDSIAEPINRIVEAMRGGERLTPVMETESQDEYEELTREFNSMIARITILIEDDYQAELKNRELKVVHSETEHSSLQQQINPHFLYNTLETIYWSGQLDGNDEVSQMVTALGNYFRSIINKGREFITVQQEVMNVDNYLFLQNKRFSQRIHLQWKVDEGCYALCIIKLTFQPVVEDIISYAVEQTDDPVGITISISVGAELLASITGSSVDLFLGSSSRKGRVGAQNVHQRLRLYFGESYGIQELSHASGSQFRVTMPLLRQIPEGGMTDSV